VELRDQVVVVTGASSGFGELIARRCVAAGAKVVLAARSAEALERLAAEIGPSRTLVVPTDVTDDVAVRHLAQATLERFGRADVLVNNAGYGILDRVADAKLADLQGMIDVNVYGAVRCTQAFLPHMRARRHGQVIMVASIAGLVATQNFGFYSATKHALVAISRSLMVEVEGSGVRLALICPGVSPTGFQQHATMDKHPNIVTWTHCTPEQVVAAILRAIARRTHGEVVVPWYGRLLALMSYPLPGVTRLVMRIVR
jgi:hypothetical protein